MQSKSQSMLVRVSQALHYALTKIMPLPIEHVKAHNDDPGNELADGLCLPTLRPRVLQNRSEIEANFSMHIGRQSGRRAPASSTCIQHLHPAPNHSHVPFYTSLHERASICTNWSPWPCLHWFIRHLSSGS